MINIFCISGIFTAPCAGVYLITFSYLGSNDPGEEIYAFLHKNEEKINETRHFTYYGAEGSGIVHSTGGRAVYQRLEAGDTITLQTDSVTGVMWNIIFCIQFINN